MDVGRKLLIAVLALALAPIYAGTPARAGPERTAPYDFGCVGRPPCETNLDPARDGQLHGSVAPWVCIFYGPPFVAPCLTHVGSSAGVYVDATTHVRIRASARVSDAGVVTPGPLATQGCLGLATPTGGGSLDYGCTAVPLGGATQISTTFEDQVLPPGRWFLYVSLSGGPGALAVESISYTLTRTSSEETNGEGAPDPRADPGAP